MTRPALVLLLLALACGEPEAPPAQSSPPAAATETVATDPSKAWLSPAEVVEAFERQLKQVSVLGPPGATAIAIREHYAPFVSTKLLDEWLREPAKAPGRQVSSPYPDRIEIETISEGETRAEVAGDIVEATNQGDVARVPVRIALAMENGEWRITAFERKPEDVPASDENAGEQSEEAVAVLKRYYAAIDAGDYERAYSAWGSRDRPGRVSKNSATALLTRCAFASKPAAPPASKVQRVRGTWKFR